MERHVLTLASGEEPLSNRPGHFVNILSKPIDLLPGDWDLGLKQISYPKKWNNILDGDAFFFLRRGSRLYRVDLEAGYYDPVEYLVETLNALLAKKGLQFDYSSHSRRVSLMFKGGGDAIFLRKSSLSELLGVCDAEKCTADLVVYRATGEYEEYTWESVLQRDRDSQKPGQSKQPMPLVKLPGGKSVRPAGLTEQTAVSLADMLRGEGVERGVRGIRVPCKVEASLDSVARLWIYCDVIATVHVGSGEKQLLAVVRAKGRHGEEVQMNYERPIYVPLYRSQLSRITIQICDERGRVVEFGGKTLLVVEAVRRRL